MKSLKEKMFSCNEYGITQGVYHKEDVDLAVAELLKRKQDGSVWDKKGSYKRRITDVILVEDVIELFGGEKK